MTDFDARFRTLLADHEQMQADYNKLRDAGHEPDVDNPQPVFVQWFEKFTEVKDRMYELAYDLDIQFEAGEVSAEDYARVWEQVQERLGVDGNRRKGTEKPVAGF